jgi:hypothetical protein
VVRATTSSVRKQRRLASVHRGAADVDGDPASLLPALQPPEVGDGVAAPGGDLPEVGGDEPAARDRQPLCNAHSDSPELFPDVALSIRHLSRAEVLVPCGCRELLDEW